MLMSVSNAVCLIFFNFFYLHVEEGVFGQCWRFSAILFEFFWCDWQQVKKIKHSGFLRERTGRLRGFP